jgi:5,10-methylenetetrahydrofolate reductase
VDSAPARYLGAPAAPTDAVAPPRPLVLVDARPREATLASAAAVGRAHAGWCDAVLVGEHHDDVDLPGSMIALAAQHEGARAWVTVACRDRNSVALEAELAACRAAEVDVVHCVTGDMRAPHVRPGTTPVFELDALRLTRLARSLGLPVSVAESPLAEPASARPARAADKARAGAAWCIVNLGVTPEQLQRFVDRTRQAGADLRFLACVPVFTDAPGAVRLGRLPGVGLDEEAVRRVLGAPRPVDAGIEHAVEQARAFLAVDGVCGVDLSGPGSTEGEADRVAVMRAVAERLKVEPRGASGPAREEDHGARA